MLTYQKLIIQEDFRKEPNSPTQNQIRVINFRPNQTESLQINQKNQVVHLEVENLQ